MERKINTVQYLPQNVSAKKAPMSGVKNEEPIQVDTVVAASTLLSRSAPVRYVTKFFAIAKQATLSVNSEPK